MSKIVNLTRGKLVIITSLIALIVSVVLTVNMGEAEGADSKTENKEVSVYVSGDKK